MSKVDDLEFFLRKVATLLHDPFDKSFDIREHKKRAGEILKELGKYLKSHGSKCFKSDLDLSKYFVERADHEASAANRVFLPKSEEGEEYEVVSLTVGQPFSGIILGGLDLGEASSYPSAKNYVSSFGDVLRTGSEIVKRSEKYRVGLMSCLRSVFNGCLREDLCSLDRFGFNKLFYCLFSGFIYCYDTLLNSLAVNNLPVGDIIYLLPEDTRVIVSPLINHLIMSAALSNIIRGDRLEGYIVRFDLGGIQEFIKQSRKTRDLWFSSFLLSLINYSFMKFIVESYGFDAFIYPWLFGLPLVNLHHDLIPIKSANELAEFSDMLMEPVIPNGYLAIIPKEYSRDKVIWEIVEGALRFWLKYVDTYEKILKEVVEKIGKRVYGREFSKNKNSLFNRALGNLRTQMEFFSIFNKVRLSVIDLPDSFVDDVQKGNWNEVYTKIIEEIMKSEEGKWEFPDLVISKSLGNHRNLLAYTRRIMENYYSINKVAQIDNEARKFSTQAKFEVEEFPTIQVEKGEYRPRQCSLCGVRLAIRFTEEEWSELESAGYVDYNERLCHVCFSKRLISHPKPLKKFKFNPLLEILSYFNEELKKLPEKKKEIIKPRYVPSTDDFSSYWFKYSILTVLYLAFDRGLRGYKEFLKSIIDVVTSINELERKINCLYGRDEKCVNYISDLIEEISRDENINVDRRFKNLCARLNSLLLEIEEIGEKDVPRPMRILLNNLIKDNPDLDEASIRDLEKFLKFSILFLNKNQLNRVIDDLNRCLERFFDEFVEDYYKKKTGKEDIGREEFNKIRERFLDKYGDYFDKIKDSVEDIICFLGGQVGERICEDSLLERLNKLLDIYESVLDEISGEGVVEKESEHDLRNELKRNMWRPIIETIFGVDLNEEDVEKIIGIFDNELVGLPVSKSISDRFALIASDGDSIGKWMAGEMLPHFITSYHPSVIEKINDLFINRLGLSHLFPPLKPGQQCGSDIHCHPFLYRFPSPSYQSTFSRTLSFNALNVFGKVIEGFGGILVYSGGDDILALTPPETWLYASKLIRILYSAEIFRLFDSGIIIPTKDGAKLNKLKLFMSGLGYRGTMSFGVVVADTKADLRLVLSYARNLEEESKEIKSILKCGDKSMNLDLKDGLSVLVMGRSEKISEARSIPWFLIIDFDPNEPPKEISFKEVKILWEFIRSLDYVACDTLLYYKNYISGVFSIISNVNTKFLGIKHNNLARNRVVVSPLLLFLKFLRYIKKGFVSRRFIYDTVEFGMSLREALIRSGGVSKDVSDLGGFLSFIKNDLKRNLRRALRKKRHEILARNELSGKDIELDRWFMGWVNLMESKILELITLLDRSKSDDIDEYEEDRIIPLLEVFNLLKILDKSFDKAIFM